MLAATALAVATKYGAPSIYNSGPQGFSETLYAYTSQTNNNGSAFAGFTGFVQPNAPGNVGAFGITFADLLGGVAMLVGRFVPLLAALAVAGSLATKRVAPGSAPARSGRTRPTFVVPARRVIVIVGRPHLLPRPAARPDRPGPDRPALLTCAATSSHPPSPILVFTVLLGLGYPLATTGVSQVVFPNKADGSQVERDGKVVGSRLIGQDFRERPALLPVAPVGHRLQPGRHVLQQPRPEPEGPARPLPGQPRRLPGARAPVQPRADGGATCPSTPSTTSASGVDPHISEANARIQARRVAEVRRLPLERVHELIDDNTDGRALGFLGEPGVNVLELNLALDEEAAMTMLAAADSTRRPAACVARASPSSTRATRSATR